MKKIPGVLSAAPEIILRPMQDSTCPSEKPCSTLKPTVCRVALLLNPSMQYLRTAESINCCQTAVTAEVRGQQQIPYGVKSVQADNVNVRKVAPVSWNSSAPQCSCCRLLFRAACASAQQSVAASATAGIL